MTTAAVALAPVGLAALALRREWRTGIGERFARIPATPSDQRAIWIHGASVGELTALAPVVRALRHEHPDDRLVVSSMTLGGRTAAAARAPDADAYVLFPLDVPRVVTRALDRVRPRLVLFSETELWPNFLAALATRRIPAIMVSGRVSAAAFARYRRWRWLFAPALASVRWFGVQTLESARRLVALGVPATRVVVTGSLKTAGPLDDDTAAGPTLASLGVDDAPVLVAASTHPGEDEVLLDAFARIRARAPRARLLLAPRKLDRLAEIERVVAARGCGLVRRSTLGPPATARWPADAPVLLLDTLGELAGLYRGARFAFVGGTLDATGGHNVLEPAAVGTPVAVGPNVANVAADVARLAAGAALLHAADTADLVARLPERFLDPVAAAAAGARAAALVGEQRGPLAVTLAIVRGTLAAQGRNA
ncbi:MAG: 3-deoxy-D-manno-octulosonic acid transferase [Deltaproteobacteria bacterium]|nr:3-deoxy-D-manno-octulosonic acid transferase [Deltaproteobacteria bacterium]